MSAFNSRINKSKELTEFLNRFLEEEKISYFESGYEFYKEHNKAFEIKNLKDNTSQFVRYYPDYTIVGKYKTILLEVKNSSGIEKECFINYSTLSKELNLDILLLCKNKKICSIKDLAFSIMNPYDAKAKMNIPVTDLIWKEPRQLDEEEYKKYLSAYNNQTSGCSFAFIDFDKTKFFDINVLKELNKISEEEK